MTSLRNNCVLHNIAEEKAACEQQLLEAVEQLQFGEASRFAIRLAFEEALSNAFKHGNRSDPAKVVKVDWTATEQQIAIEVQDEGPGFDVEAVPDPTADENLEIPAGRGLLLMRAYMTDVQIKPPGNCVRMVYEKPA